MQFPHCYSKNAAIILCLVVSFASAAVMREFYVAPDGNDASHGTLQSPFKTIDRAKTEVRKHNSTMTGDIIVYLRGGTFTLDTTIVLTSQDGGSNGHFVIYRAYQTEKPIISGGRKVSGWTMEGNVWKVSIPDATKKLRHLYVNGQRAQMSTNGTFGGVEYNNTGITFAKLPSIAQTNPADIEIEQPSNWYNNLGCAYQVGI